MCRRLIISLCFFLLSTTAISAEQQKPYAPDKVVYDVSSEDPVLLNNILDRVSLLQNIYDNNPFEASIVIVVHEGAIPLFKTDKNHKKVPGLMDRARSLTMGEIIQFRICEASARMQKINKIDLHDFITMVPMADAEIIALQHSGYAYLR